jgi:GntR family transcriptional regulator
MLEIQNNSPVPIYEQLISEIMKMVHSGELKAGESMPSIRNLASTLDIAVNTVARAYNELERDGYIKSYGVKGTFVSEFKSQESKELSELSALLKSLTNRGYSKNQIYRIIEENLSEFIK